MTKYFIGLLLPLVLIVSNIEAQEIEWDKYEVGIDLLWLIKKNNVPPSFFLKKLELKQKKSDLGFIRRGFRLRIGGVYEKPNEKTSVNGYPFLRQSNYSVVIRPGYEWHQKIKSFDVFYGLDLNNYFSGSKMENYILSLNTSGGGYTALLFTQKNKYLNIGLSPVLGTTIKIYKGISLTLESTVDLYYSQRTYSYTGNPDYDDIKTKGNGFGLNTYPLYTMNATFSF